jgi:heme-degrading monooxygenase HmoA
LEETGIKEIKDTKGNQGVWLMRRVHEGRAEFIVISMWDSLASIKAFAGIALTAWSAARLSARKFPSSKSSRRENSYPQIYPQRTVPTVLFSDLAAPVENVSR